MATQRWGRCLFRWRRRKQAAPLSDVQGFGSWSSTGWLAITDSYRGRQTLILYSICTLPPPFDRRLLPQRTTIRLNPTRRGYDRNYTVRRSLQTNIPDVRTSIFRCKLNVHAVVGLPLRDRHVRIALTCQTRDLLNGALKVRNFVSERAPQAEAVHLERVAAASVFDGAVPPRFLNNFHRFSLPSSKVREPGPDV